MRAPVVVLRDMHEHEYDAYAAARDADYTAELLATMPADAARAKARRDRERFLPEGLATPGHRLVMAEDATGAIVGSAWVGFADPATGSTDAAWLYDLVVVPAFRRSGYGAAILRAVEGLAREAGAQRLGLNVFGANTAAMALYTSCGYRVTAQQMAKPL